ncbi:hypothetical protein DL93DRAFT_2096530 [Clavulina sp. PMI_390]|nr:hypothetical protein DL93DRAFT_2096530 [Clavulina sp. PMI_390]
MLSVSPRSRLIVKNLPHYISDQRIREHFSTQGGTITDVKLVHKSDGTSRRFAFVGFKSDTEAAKAKSYFDRSYIDTSRISVLIVDPSKTSERPAKRQRLHSDSRKSHQPATPNRVNVDDEAGSSSKPKPSIKDASLSEFLDVMKPRTKKERSWANNETSTSETISSNDEQTSSTSTSIPNPRAHDTKGKSKALPEDELMENGDGPEQYDAVSDLEWMRRRMASSALGSENSAAAENDLPEDARSTNGKTPDEPPAEVPAEPGESIEDQLKKSPRLYLRNLAYSCTTSDLEEAFAPFGQVVQAHIPINAASQTSKGMGFVTFSSADAAIAAQRAMHKSTFQGRILHAMPAISRRREADPNDKQSVKDQKMQKLKENAGKDFNWSMLYMNSDAVVSSVADRLKISKADILNPDWDDAAVKMALAETHVIQETKKYLEDEGVDLNAFNTKQRSDTIMLVKNIPYGTTLSELTEIFSPHGDISRLLLPPAGTIALVEFMNATDAGKAFNAVKYRRLKNSIIYLERAPAGLFKSGTGTNDARISSGVKPVLVPEGGAGASTSSGTAAGGDDSGPAEAAAGATIFIKNLNFGTTTEKLVKTLQHLPSFAFARVQMKPDPKRPGGTLSMGYGFVGFKDKEAAKKALVTIEGFVLDGHSLVAKFAQRGVEEVQKESGTTKPKNASTKIIVKNLPFEATKKDVRTLFGAHGQLKSVRLPKKFNAGSRGFAFLEFVSHKEADNAMAALRHTHLLGRHVVVEWAEDNGAGGDLDVLRERIKTGYGDGKEERPGRKRKLDMDVLDSNKDAGDDGEEFIAV